MAMLTFSESGVGIPFMMITIYGPRSTLGPMMFVTEFVLFLNTGPLNAAIVNAAVGLLSNRSGRSPAPAGDRPVTAVSSCRTVPR